MYGFNQTPSQRHAPSPGPGWTVLQEPESDSEEEDQEDGMLNRAYSSSQSSRENTTRASGFSFPAVRRNVLASSQPAGSSGSSSNAPSQAQTLADTLNSLSSGSQPGKQSGNGRTRLPGELTPWKARTTTSSDASRMPPPAFSASQLARANGSQVASSSAAALSSTNTNVTQSIAKPYATKQVARKSTNPSARQHTFPEATSQAVPSSSQSASSRDKGKGKERDTDLPDFRSSYTNSSSSFPVPSSSAPPRVSVGAPGSASGSKTRINRPAASSDSEDFPDATQFAALSQAQRLAKKVSEDRLREKSRFSGSSKDGGNQSRKQLTNGSIPSRSSRPLRPPSSTQPARINAGSSGRMESISAPLPATQPASSRGIRKDNDVIVLSGSSDDEHAAEYLRKREERRKSNVVGTNNPSASQQPPSTQRSKTPEMIDLTADVDDAEPHPARQTVRKSTGPSTAPRNFRKPPPLASSQSRRNTKSMVLDNGFVDLTLDGSPPQPSKVQRAIEQEPMPRQSVDLGPPSSSQAALETAEPDSTSLIPDVPTSPTRSPTRPRQTARKTTGLPPSPSSPRQTARKTTPIPQMPKSPPQVTPDLPQLPRTSRQTARKTTGPGPSQVSASPRQMARKRTEFTPVLESLPILPRTTTEPAQLSARPRQTGRKTTGPGPSQVFVSPRQTGRRRTHFTPVPESPPSPLQTTTDLPQLPTAPRQTARKGADSIAPSSPTRKTTQPPQSHSSPRQTARKTTRPHWLNSPPGLSIGSALDDPFRSSPEPDSPTSSSTAQKPTGYLESFSPSSHRPNSPDDGLYIPRTAIDEEQMDTQPLDPEPLSASKHSLHVDKEAVAVRGTKEGVADSSLVSSWSKVPIPSAEAMDAANSTASVAEPGPEPLSDYVSDESAPMDILRGRDGLEIPNPDDDAAPPSIGHAVSDARVSPDLQDAQMEIPAVTETEQPDASGGRQESTSVDDHCETLSVLKQTTVVHPNNTDSDSISVEEDYAEVDALIHTGGSTSPSQMSLLPSVGGNSNTGHLSVDNQKNANSSSLPRLDAAIHAPTSLLGQDLSTASKTQTAQDAESSVSPSTQKGQSLELLNDSVPTSSLAAGSSEKATVDVEEQVNETILRPSTLAKEPELPSSLLRNGTGTSPPPQSPSSSSRPSSATASHSPSPAQAVPTTSDPLGSGSPRPRHSQRPHIDDPLPPRSLPMTGLLAIADAIKTAGLKNAQIDSLRNKLSDSSVRESSRGSLLRRTTPNDTERVNQARDGAGTSDGKKRISTPLTMLRQQAETSSRGSSRRSSVDLSVTSRTADSASGGAKGGNTAPIAPGLLSGSVAQSTPRKRLRTTSTSGSERAQGNSVSENGTLNKAAKRLRESSPSRIESTLPSRYGSPSDSADDFNLLDAASDAEVTVVDHAAENAAKKRPAKVLRAEANGLVGREFGPLYCRAEDLPHELANAINAIPEWFRYHQPEILRQVFESSIMTNTTFDEPDAPYIRIINEVDDEAIPPFEFYYTNLMWHGDNIPPPNTSTLKGCGCVGRCDPRDRKCSCLKRAKETCDRAEIKKGFLYDMKGRLRVHDYPVYECNELCGCSEDCWNRVVQQGRKCTINIVKTVNKGWGIFAGKRIPSGTFVGIYSGEIVTDEEGERRGFIYNKVGRTYLFDIDFWHIRENGKEGDMNFTVDAFHAGNFTRFLNHSCDPNCKINAVYINETNPYKPLLAIFTTRDVDAGEELCFSYYGDIDDEDDKPDSPSKSAHLHSKAGGLGDVYRKCECGAQRCRGYIFN